MNFALGKKTQIPITNFGRERASTMRKMSMEIQFPELIIIVILFLKLDFCVLKAVSFDLPRWVGKRKVDSASQCDISC